MARKDAVHNPRRKPNNTSGVRDDDAATIALADAAKPGRGYTSAPATQPPYSGNTPWGADQIPRDLPSVSPDKPPLTVYGASGTPILNGVISQAEEYNEDFYWKRSCEIFERMLRSDGTVQSLEQAIKLPLLSAKWYVQPATSDDADTQLASFIETCLFHDMRRENSRGDTLTQPWSEILDHILLHVFFGFALFEVCYRLDKPTGLVKWNEWRPLLPRTIWKWHVDPNNDLVGIQQRTWKNYSYQYIDIPIEKILRFTRSQRGQNYEGTSILRAAYKHWYYKDQMYKVQAIGVERESVGYPFIYLPKDASPADVDAARQIVANMRVSEDMGGVLPAEARVEYAASHASRGGAVNASEPINHHDALILRGALAQFLINGTQENGTRAMDTGQEERFLRALSATANYICDIINNDAIPRLIGYNFDQVALYPRLVCPPLTSQDLSMLGNALQVLGQIQMINPADPAIRNFVFDKFGMPQPTMDPVQATNPGGFGGGGAGGGGSDEPNSQDSGGDDEGSDQGDQNEQGDAGDGGDGGATGGGDGGDGGGSFAELDDEALSEALRLADEIAFGGELDAVARGEQQLALMERLSDAAQERADDEDDDDAAVALSDEQIDEVWRLAQWLSDHAGDGDVARTLAEMDDEEAIRLFGFGGFKGFGGFGRAGRGGGGSSGGTGSRGGSSERPHVGSGDFGTDHPRGAPGNRGEFRFNGGRHKPEPKGRVQKAQDRLASKDEGTGRGGGGGGDERTGDARTGGREGVAQHEGAKDDMAYVHDRVAEQVGRELAAHPELTARYPSAEVAKAARDFALRNAGHTDREYSNFIRADGTLTNRNDVRGAEWHSRLTIHDALANNDRRQISIHTHMDHGTAFSHDINPTQGSDWRSYIAHRPQAAIETSGLGEHGAIIHVLVPGEHGWPSMKAYRAALDEVRAQFGDGSREDRMDQEALARGEHTAHGWEWLRNTNAALAQKLGVHYSYEVIGKDGVPEHARAAQRTARSANAATAAGTDEQSSETPQRGPLEKRHFLRPDANVGGARQSAEAATAKRGAAGSAKTAGDEAKASGTAYPEPTEAIRAQLTRRAVGPFAPVDVHYVRAIMADNHLAEHLSQYMTSTLRESALYHGLSQGGSRAALIERLVQHATSVSPEESVRIANANTQANRDRTGFFQPRRDANDKLLNRSTEVLEAKAAKDAARAAKPARTAAATAKPKSARAPEAPTPAKASGNAYPEPTETIRAQLTRRPADPFATVDVHSVRAIMGDNHLAEHLSQYMTSTLRESALYHGLSQGGSRAALIERLVQHATSVSPEESVRIANANTQANHDKQGFFQPRRDANDKLLNRSAEVLEAKAAKAAARTARTAKPARTAAAGKSTAAANAASAAATQREVARAAKAAAAQEQVKQGYRDWASGRAYVDNAGNYRLHNVDENGQRVAGSKVAAWNKAVAAAHGKGGEGVEAFHAAAEDYAKAHPDEIPTYKHGLVALPKPAKPAAASPQEIAKAYELPVRHFSRPDAANAANAANGRPATTAKRANVAAAGAPRTGRAAAGTPAETLAGKPAAVKAAAAKPAAETDEHGQALPFTHDEFAQALTRGQRVAGGNVAKTSAVTINGRDYIVKRSDDSGTHGFGQTNDARTVTAREGAGRELANLAGMGDAVPRESYHIVGANGEHYSVQSREPGKPVSDLSLREQDQFDKAVQADPRHAILQYVLAGNDRHEGNTLFDPASGKITHIDMGFEFGRGASYRQMDYSPVHQALASYTHGERVPLSADALKGFTDHAQEIEQLADKYHLPAEDKAGLHRRLGVLQQVAATPHPSLGTLYNAAEQAYREDQQAARAQARRAVTRPVPSLHPSLGAPSAAARSAQANVHRNFLARLLGRGR